MKKIEMILSVTTLCIILVSCNTGIDGRYKQMYSSVGDGEFVFDKDGTYTYEIEWKYNPSIMGSGGTKKGDIDKDKGTWWLDTTDLDGNKVTFNEFSKDPESHNVWIAYKVNDGKFNKNHKTNYFLIKGRDNWYPELWTSSMGEKKCYKAFLPF